jgi:DNA-binding NarL/FixJ family response regulator
MVEEAAAYEFEYDHPDLLQAWDAMAREDNARAVALIEALTERARREGSFHLWGMLAQHLADAELRRGNIAAACDLVDRAYRVCADGSRDESVLYFRAIVRAWSGRLDEARTDAANGLAMARRVHNSLFELPCRHALGFVALSAGDSAAAAAHYGAVAAGMRAMGWRHPGLMMWHGNAVEAFVGAGRRAEAVDLTEDLAALAERLDLTTCAAVALRCRGLVREDAGDLEAAAAALDESVRLSEPLDNPLEHARTLLVRGVVQRRRRQKARSREDLGRACEIFTRHGATVWAARAARELERSLPAAAGGELTGAERAVAELAAAGATNREIAAELYLSEKTVEAVLTRVYRKLAVRSRTQLGHHPELRHATEGRR